MLETKIEWADATVNFWWGCAKVSPACEHCYAEALDLRLHPALNLNLASPKTKLAAHWGPDAPRLLRIEAATREAFKLQRRAVNEGRSIRVFTNSMSDFFEDRRDLDMARLEAFNTMRLTPNLVWMVLTKRPENILELISNCLQRLYSDLPCGLYPWLNSWIAGLAPSNVWLGTTVENQEWGEVRIPRLLAVPAAVRFLSVEPTLGPVNLMELLRPWAFHTSPHGWPAWLAQRLHWVICGGESGPKARPMHPDWPRNLRDHCVAAGVPFFFKQWGEYEDTGWHGSRPGDVAVWLDGGTRVLRDAEFPTSREAAIMRRVGKARAGRLLDGVEHSAIPEVR